MAGLYREREEKLQVISARISMYCMHESRALSSFPYDFLSLLIFSGVGGGSQDDKTT